MHRHKQKQLLNSKIAILRESMDMYSPDSVFVFNYTFRNTEYIWRVDSTGSLDFIGSEFFNIEVMRKYAVTQEIMLKVMETIYQKMNDIKNNIIDEREPRDGKGYTYRINI